jgi:FSR family fosmidomycin resistance protein-like MFS transporter
MFALRRHPVSHSAAPANRPTLSTLLANRTGTLALLLVTSTLRVLPMLGVPLALAFAIKLAGGGNDRIGLVQSIFLVGIGVGSLASAWVVRPANERTAMWLLPLAAVAPIAASAALTGWPGLAAVAVSGLILGGAMPVLIGYGQQLLPEAQRVASSITMGVTWGLGGLRVAAAMAYFNRLGSPQQAIYLFAACAAVSAVLSMWLPAGKMVPTASQDAS